VSVPTLSLSPLRRPPDVTVVVPGSKSHTNRALVCAALADGPSELRGALAADDTAAMVGALRALSITVDEVGGDRLVVVGTGGRLPAGPLEVFVGQSGTTGRFVLPMLALGPGPYRLDGADQLRQRPFGPLAQALRSLGAEVDGDELPIVVRRGARRGGRVELSGSVSSQFLSGLVLSAPLLPGGLVVDLTDELVSRPYLQLTIRTLEQFGAGAEVTADHRQVRVPQAELRAGTVDIEPDASAASYFFAAAATTGGRVRIEGLGSQTVQGDLRFVDVLEQMGAEVRRGRDWTEVRGTGRLSGVEADLADLSDTAQTLAVAATFADSPTRITGIGFIRRKETDRIGALVTELSRLGIQAVEEADGLVVHPGTPVPGVVATYDDHRMAMSFALLGLVHRGITIAEPGCVAKTFPGFWRTLDTLRRPAA
jgi:3-phosphoshikimate 1-carboxyvinyltransferase